MDPAFDRNPTTTSSPAPTKSTDDYTVTQEQIDQLGDELSRPDRRGRRGALRPDGAADASDPASDSLVMLVYNVQDDAYYDCAATTYTAGYFAPDYIDAAA